MDRLDFELPEFTRFTWVSDRAREVWEPRLKRIRTAWMEIEWQAVAQGVRRCAITFASPEDYLTQGVRWAALGLNALPLELHGVSNYTYRGRALAAQPGKPFVFRFILGTPQNVVVFKAAYDASDEKAIAGFLGYPTCCYEMYRRVWVEDGQVDTTWPMAVGSVPSVNGDRLVHVEGPPESNILWRWAGIRAVSHLPCRFDCPHTTALGRKLLDVGRKVGFGDEMDWLREILSWPSEWSALHGIAEIRTPILKISTNTDATATKYVVRRRGTSYPAEGAQGLVFPYQTPDRLFLTESRGFKQGLSNPLPVVEAPPEGYATDNGFSSRQAMDEAHAPLVALAAAALAGRGGNVLDLGCGNGALLKKICEADAAAVPFGVEPVADRVRNAGKLLPRFAENFFRGSMFDNDDVWAGGRRFALALLMPGRFLEAGPERSARLKRQLKERCDRILVYAYGDWLTRYGDLAGLAERAGLQMVETGPEKKVGLALLA